MQIFGNQKRQDEVHRPSSQNRASIDKTPIPINMRRITEFFKPKRDNGRLDEMAQDSGRDEAPTPTRTRKKRKTSDSLREMESDSSEQILDVTDLEYLDKESTAASDFDDDELETAVTEIDSII
jgi:hypothetical protein